MAESTGQAPLTAYPDADRYDTASPEWRDICLARWVCMQEDRRGTLKRLCVRHGEAFENLARAQWEARDAWLPGYLAALPARAKHQLGAQLADQAFCEGHVFETHAQIAASLLDKSNFQAPAAPRNLPVLDADLDDFTRRRVATPEFELTP